MISLGINCRCLLSISKQNDVAGRHAGRSSFVSVISFLDCWWALIGKRGWTALPVTPVTPDALPRDVQDAPLKITVFVDGNPNVKVGKRSILVRLADA